MDEQKIVSLTCLCGRCQYSTPVSRSSLPLECNICHCEACQHASGTLGMPYFNWPSPYPDFSLLSRYDFSARVWIYFCPNCGTHMFWQMHQRPRNLLANAGTLNDPDEIIRIGSHIFVKGVRDGGSADWLPIIDDRPLARWAEHQELNPKDLSQLVPLGWRVDLDVTIDSNLLRANCLCGGVEFFVTKPSNAPAPVGTIGDEWWLDTNDRFIATLCACRTCRLAAGNDVMHTAFIPTANIILPDGKPYSPDIGTMKWYRSSNVSERSFCSRCGATVFFQSESRMTNEYTGLLNVAAGLFCAEDGARAENWVRWITSKLDHDDSAAHARVVKSMKVGLQQWGEKTYGTDSYLANDDNMRRVLLKVVTTSMQQLT